MDTITDLSLDTKLASQLSILINRAIPQTMSDDILQQSPPISGGRERLFNFVDTLVSALSKNARRALAQSLALSGVEFKPTRPNMAPILDETRSNPFVTELKAVFDNWPTFEDHKDATAFSKSDREFQKRAAFVKSRI
ncbi:MAG: hypothetical protein OXU45_06390 [Candidatus Melainabacteria bacterium]|nr:hypothetical protein [Candidatus Melainabacteria bacterium]